MGDDLYDEHGDYKLVAYCEVCEEWWKFTAVNTLHLDKEECPKCGHSPSQQIGFQIISQRTFRPELHGKKKPKNSIKHLH